MHSPNSYIQILLVIVILRPKAEITITNKKVSVPGGFHKRQLRYFHTTIKVSVMDDTQRCQLWITLKGISNR